MTITIPTSSIAILQKYPNWYFWFENLATVNKKHFYQEIRFLIKQLSNLTSGRNCHSMMFYGLYEKRREKKTADFVLEQQLLSVDT
jgi:hypothetical protein